MNKGTKQKGPSGIFILFLHFCTFFKNIVVIQPYHHACYTYYAKHVYHVYGKSLMNGTPHDP